MNKMLALVCGAVLAANAAAQRWTRGLPADPSFFPLGVWLQSPHNAARYRELGVNLYVGLYGGPTTEQLKALDDAGMRTICAQNEAGLAHEGGTIVGWLHGDEPDNAQGRRLTGYAPPIPPWQIVEAYERLHRTDPSRPILLNLGQGAAWDGWHGRGERTNHPEDYPQYVKGCDFVSFDIYPVTHTHRDVKGRLEIVGRGVQRLRAWGEHKKPVWACIETAHVDNAAVRPTPEQVRAEAWIAIACGASGIIWFAHEFAPKFVEAGLLEHAEIAAAVKAVDAEILAHAAALNSPMLTDVVDVEVEPAGEVAVRVHRVDDVLYVFAAALQPESVRATFRCKGGGARVTVLGEKRTLKAEAGRFTDELPGYAIRHYRVEK